MIIDRSVVLEGIRKGLVTPLPLALKEINNNKEQMIITMNYLSGKSVEGFNINFMDVISGGLMKFIMLIVSLSVFVWAIWALISFYKSMDAWAIIAAIVLLFVPCMGPIASLLVIYLNKQERNSFSFYNLM